MPSHLLRITRLSLDALREIADSQRLYALLDACDAPDVPVKVAELGEGRAVSLYRGLPEEEYSAFAPYLACADMALVDWIAAHLWHDAWGVFVVFDGPLPALRSHFRHFLIVDDPQGEKMYFRFYDPRVLPKYLPTCTTQELRRFYGGIGAFLIGDPNDPAAVQSIAQGEDAALFAPVTASVVTRIGERFPIRAEQMAIFEQTASEDWTQGLAKEVKSKYPNRLPANDENLLKSVTAWIADARLWGFRTEAEIKRYVHSCVQTQGQRDPIETRLQTYLNLHHENLLRGVDVQHFAHTATQFALRHRVYQEEGVAWLAVILLAGYRKGDFNPAWIDPILDQPKVTEESRVLQVHQNAIARGWIASKGVS